MGFDIHVLKLTETGGKIRKQIIKKLGVLGVEVLFRGESLRGCVFVCAKVCV